MYRYSLLRGVSACALTFAAFSQIGEPAFAQTNLPTIDIGGQRRPAQTTAARPSGQPTTRAAGRTAAPAAPAPTPSPVVSRWSPTLPDGRPAFVEKWQLPNTVASVTRKQIEQQVNIIDTEDAVKYLPSLFLRKRNNGDTQAVMQTRTYGVSSSARSLVYADDLLLTALIGNDNTIGAPRWGLVAPEEIDRVDMLYGPFSAQYPGNSIGGVLKITTRMPEKLEVTAKETVALQDFSLWGTSQTFWTSNFAATAGDKINDFSWFVSGNWLRGTTQPLTYVTLQSLYGYPGAYFNTTKFGLPAEVLGSTGNLANDQVNGKIKLAYDITPTIRATYQVGIWSNDGASIPENYLVSGYGPFFGRNAGPGALGTATLQSFASGYYRIQEKMLINSAAVRSNSGGLFDFEISASHFNYLQSNQRSPYSGAYTAGYTQTGRNAVYTGTYWTLLDLKGILRPDGALSGHDISFGLHGDQFHLNNPTWLTTNWTAGTSAAYGVVASIGNGTTRTQALWAQDAWKIRDDLKFTVGIRGEHWAATDGYNQGLSGINAIGFGAGPLTPNFANSLLPIYQPNLYHTRFSPKGSLQWEADQNWTITGSIGLANRFPTAKELYSLSTLTTTGQNTNPNPNLRPEVSLSKELAFERKIKDGSVRLSLFDEEVRDFIFNQNVIVPGANQLVSTPVNIDRIRNSGVELAWRRDNLLLKGLEFTGSVTWLNARVISDSNWIPTQTNPAVLSGNLDWWTGFNVNPNGVNGKTVPNVPDWRWTALATYRPDDHWAFTLAARYQGRMWTVLSNNDIAHGVYQSFDRFFIVDTKIHYKYDDRWSFDFGVDNIGNYKYFLFHPFPQRTFVTAVKYEFGTGKGAPGIFAGGDRSGLPDFSRWFQPAAFTID